MQEQYNIKGVVRNFKRRFSVIEWISNRGLEVQFPDVDKSYMHVHNEI